MSVLRPQTSANERQGSPGGAPAEEPLTCRVPPPRTRGVRTLRTAKKIVVLVVGGTVLAAGLALLVLPGPAFLVIPAGLGILATEYVWAQRLLRRIRDEVAARLGPARLSPQATSHGGVDCHEPRNARAQP